MQGPDLGVALEHAGIGGGTGDRAAHQAAERRRVQLQADSLGRGIVRGADQTAGAGFDVVGVQAPGHALIAFALGVRRHGEAEAGGAADTLDEGLQQVRAGEVGVTRHLGAGVAIGPLHQKRAKLAGLDGHVDDLAVDHGDGREGLIRRIAQRSGDRAALGFIGAQVDPQVFGFVAESGGQTEIVALAVQAVGVDVGALDALARNGGVAAEGPAAVFLGEAFQQFDIGAEAVDVDGQSLRPAWFARRLQLGSA
ncbi:hypothetical protein D3C73_1062830 [compost metagenome]